MGELWTDEMEKHWQAIFEEVKNPRDFLVARDININDRVRGFVLYAVLAIRHWAGGEHKPWPVRQHIEVANIQRQLDADPARQKEIEEWMKANPMKGDPFEGLIFDDD